MYKFEIRILKNKYVKFDRLVKSALFKVLCVPTLVIHFPHLFGFHWCINNFPKYKQKQWKLAKSNRVIITIYYEHSQDGGQGSLNLSRVTCRKIAVQCRRQLYSCDSHSPTCFGSLLRIQKSAHYLPCLFQASKSHDCPHDKWRISGQTTREYIYWTHCLEATTLLQSKQLMPCVWFMIQYK